MNVIGSLCLVKPLSGFICRKFTWLAQTISTQPFSAHLVLEHMLYELAAQSCDMMLHEVRWGCFLSGALKGAPHLRIQFNNILPNIRSFSAFTFFSFFFFYHLNLSMCFQFGSSTFPSYHDSYHDSRRGAWSLSPSALFIKSHTPLCPFTLPVFSLSGKTYIWHYIFNFDF